MYFMRPKHYVNSTRLDRFDQWLRYSIEDGVIVVIAVIIPGMFITALLFAIGGGLSTSHNVTPDRAPLTVTRTSANLNETAYAEAVTASGETVLVKGKWVPGDKVNAYPYPHEDAPDAAPTYSTDDPNSVLLGAFLWSLLGFVLGIFITPAILIAYLLVRGQHYKRIERSRTLVNAAIN